jgi:hypothetical protein
MVTHNGSIFVFDSQARLRLLMNDTTPVDTMVHDLELLLHEAPRAD